MSCDSTGYLQVNLSKNGKVDKKHVHRLVAEAFIPNPENKPQVNHKDGNRTNSNVNNLEWVTDSENKYHAYTLNRKRIDRPIKQYDIYEQFIKKWDSIKEAQLYYKTNHISECCRGKQKTTSGFIWKYEEE